MTGEGPAPGGDSALLARRARDLVRRPTVSCAPATSAADAARLMSRHGVGSVVIIDDSGVHLRCRYPDTHVARASVGTWLDALVARMRGLASDVPGPQGSKMES